MNDVWSCSLQLRPTLENTRLLVPLEGHTGTQLNCAKCLQSLFRSLSFFISAYSGPHPRQPCMPLVAVELAQLSTLTGITKIDTKSLRPYSCRQQYTARDSIHYKRRKGTKFHVGNWYLKRIFFSGLHSSFAWQTLRQPETRTWKSEWVIVAGRLYFIRKGPKSSPEGNVGNAAPQCLHVWMQCRHSRAVCFRQGNREFPISLTITSLLSFEFFYGTRKSFFSLRANTFFSRSK